VALFERVAEDDRGRGDAREGGYRRAKEGEPSMNSRNLAPGLILIGLGVFFFIVQLTGVGAEAIVAVIGGAFLVAYAATRQYGFLVPGGILTGLGLGVIWETQLASGEGGEVVIGLGLGFIAIYVIDALVRRSEALWWPIIPGGILVAIGVLIETEQGGLLAGMQWIWPVLLIAVGAIVLVMQMRTRAEEPAAPAEAPRETAPPVEPTPQHR
jgi:hypothetical protein